MAEVKVTNRPLDVRYITTPQISGEQADLRASSSWAVPLENTSQNSNCRADGLGVCWTVKYTEGNKSLERKFWSYPSASTTSSSLEIIPQFGPTFFYPRGTRKAIGVVVGVAASNAKGHSPCKNTNAGAYLYDPVPPTMGEPEFDEHGILTVPVECKQNTPRQPLYDVKWTREVYDSQLKTTATASNAVGDGTGDVDFDVTFDAVSYQVFQENPNRFIKMTAKAYARGMHGDSKEVSKSVYLSLPLRPVIQGVQVSQGSYTDRVTVRFTTKTDGVNQNVLNQHPFTGCRIQYLKNVTETNAATAYAMDGWENYDVEDNGACTALYVPASVVRPDPDKITWIRIKCWNQSEAVLWRASVPYRLTALETESPTAEDDAVVLAPLKVGGDGTSIVADLYWDKDGTDDSTGTQVDWSTDGYAWASTVEPSTYNTLRDDGAATYDGVSYRSHTTLYIRDLEVGETYYVKARRYLEGDGATTYGKWSTKRSVVVSKAPDSVTLSAPERIAYGAPLPVTWVVGGMDESQPELSWQLDAATMVNGTMTSAFGLLTGTGGTRASIPWDNMGTAYKSAYRREHGGADPTDADRSVEVTLYVVVTLTAKGGGAVTSEAVAVMVKYPPEVSLLLNNEQPTDALHPLLVTTQPFAFEVRASEPMSSLDAVLRSLGAAGDLPDGERLMQEPGHVMWSGRVTELTELDEPFPYDYGYLVTLPFVDNVVDHAYYELSVRGTAQVDGSMSEVAVRDVHVIWDHAATEPGAFTVVPADFTDELGTRHRQATVTITSRPDYNVAEFFGHYLGDSDYWHNPANIYEHGEDLGDGWARLTGGETELAFNCSPLMTAPEMGYLEESATYTVVFEVKNLSEGARLDFHLYSQANAVWATGKHIDGVTEEGTYRITNVTKDSFDRVTHLRTFVDVLGAADVRLSMYEGEYDGPYSPYAHPAKSNADTFDLYRVTTDGATLVASDVSVGTPMVDPYAPFGELGGSYRLCTVTEDGAMAWRDEEYALGGRDMRIDFGNEYVELPYNVDMSDGFEKDFEARHHYGGGRPEGYWNEGVGRHSSLSTDLIRVADAEVARRVRMLAQHVGPCFVRLPNGCAFEADVQVTDLSEGHASSAIAVALDVTEVSPSGAYEIGRP